MVANISAPPLAGAAAPGRIENLHLGHEGIIDSMGRTPCGNPNN